jgi:hypothetical protein
VDALGRLEGAQRADSGKVALGADRLRLAAQGIEDLVERVELPPLDPRPVPDGESERGQR